MDLLKIQNKPIFTFKDPHSNKSRSTQLQYIQTTSPIMNDQSILDLQKHNNKVTRILNKLSQKHPTMTQEIDLALYSCLKIQKILKKHHQNFHTSNGHSQSHNHLVLRNSPNTDSIIPPSQQDQLYTNALTVIQGFKSATKKLQNKFSILLRQQNLAKHIEKAKQNHFVPPYDQGVYIYPNIKTNKTQSRDHTTNVKKKNRPNYQYTYENGSFFTPHTQGEGSSGKRKYKNTNSGSKRNEGSGDMQRRRVKNYMQESESYEDGRENGNESKNISELDEEIVQLASKIKHLMKKK